MSAPAAGADRRLTDPGAPQRAPSSEERTGSRKPAGGHRRLTLRPEGPAGSGRVGGLVTWPADRPLLADVVPVFEQLGVRVADALALPDEDGVAPSRLELLLPAGTCARTALPAL